MKIFYKKDYLRVLNEMKSIQLEYDRYKMDSEERMLMLEEELLNTTYGKSEHEILQEDYEHLIHQFNLANDMLKEAQKEIKKLQKENNKLKSKTTKAKKSIKKEAE